MTQHIRNDPVTGTLNMSVYIISL